MANITNINISIVVNALPAPPPPTSATQSSPSPSASGTSRSTGQQLVGSQGFWGLMIVVAFLAAGAGYLLWRRPASKGEDLEEASPKDVTVGEQPKETCEEIPKGDDVKAGPPPEAPETLKNTREDIPVGDEVASQTPKTPKTPAPSTTPKGKKKPTTEKMVAVSTLACNVAHGVNEFTIDPPAVMAGSVC